MTDRAQEIAERLRAATQGKWEADEFGNVSSSTGYPVVTGMESIDPENHYCEDAANGAFIAHCGGEDGDVAWLLAKNDRLQKLTSRDAREFMQGLVDECSSEIAKRKAAEAECLEQARLNGMGAERELALMGRLSRAEADLERARAERDAALRAVAWFSSCNPRLSEQCPTEHAAVLSHPTLAKLRENAEK